MSLLEVAGVIDVSAPGPTTRIDGPRMETAMAALPRAELRVVLYSHDTMGLGHLRRNQLIAQAITESFTTAKVLLIAGVRQACSLELPPRTDCLTLPGFCKSSAGCYESRSLDLPIEALAGMRSASIRAAVESFDPDLFVVDKAPRGVSGELDDVLAWLCRRGKARKVLGLRDVLDEPVAVRNDWRRGAYAAAVERFYDEIWVYGDPRVYDLAAEYSWDRRLTAKTRYLGYLDQRRRLGDLNGRDSDILANLKRTNGPLVVCTVGGGQDGDGLAQSFLRAALPDCAHAALIAGPFMPPVVRRELESLIVGDPRRQLIDYLSEADALIQRADLLVTMGGYNSVGSALSFGVPTLIVPRTVPRREQLIRAQRLAALNLVDVMDPSQATATAIGEWMAHPPLNRPQARSVIDLTGLDRLTAIVSQLTPASKERVHA